MNASVYRIARQMLMGAASYVIVHDGAVQYPVRRADLLEGDTERRIAAMNGEAYAAWCAAVPAALECFPAGDSRLTRLTDRMIERGAEYWRVG